ncbi:MAG: DUF2042 domain-containing protein [Candidatus Lokiarchaeota archaeon]|nr:DUF2042 domain-containing protein [Candidatus Lokiarchaeota archaeon]
MFKKIKGKVKESVDKIKHDLKDLDLSQKQRNILIYLKERGGISNIELMSNDLGYLSSVIHQEIDELLGKKIIEGSYIFNDTEFILHEYIKAHILMQAQNNFEVDFNNIIQDFGVPITIVRDLISDLYKNNKIQGFFDIPENKTFFSVSKEDEKKFLNLLKDKRQDIKDLAIYVEDLILSNEDLDVDSLIEKIEEKPKKNDEDEFLLLAEELVKENINVKRARIWIENLISCKKISGTFDKNLETFTSDHVFLGDLLDEIQMAGRIGLYDIESRYGVTSKEKIKTYIQLLEVNKGLKGQLTEDGEEYITEEKIIEEIKQIIGSTEEILISTINSLLGLESGKLADLIYKLTKKGKLKGILSQNKEKFYQINKIKAAIMEDLSEVKEIEILEIANKYDISQVDAVLLIKELIKKYSKQLRGYVTSDSILFIKEEPLNFKIMAFIDKFPENKILLTTLQHELKLDEETLLNVLNNMLEFGLIQGKISKDLYIKK